MSQHQREDEEFEFNQPVEIMRLTLFYRGPLHAASRDDPRNDEKHRIRRCFHKQMADLWETHPALENALTPWKTLSEEEQIRNGPNDFVTAYDIGEFRFVPLVTKRHWLAAELDILFLRHEPPGFIVDNESGDIDNRVKVLFDALRMPSRKPTSREIPAQDRPLDGERPFLCLLEDDALITRLGLETDRLLSRQMTTESEVELVIRVRVRAIKTMWGTIGVGGD